MRFTVVSHACLYVESGDVALMVDPWVSGSAYWRSWWNYPPVDPQLARNLHPTHIFITHIHWDHFHGPSLRLYGKHVPILIPQDRYDRMERDLRSMGFKNVTAVPHGRRVELGPELAIQPYLFLPMTDTALVIKTPQATLLNANDCKICGLPLAKLMREHPRIDFAFRSHSSANSRACHRYLDRADTPVDDPGNYVRSFTNFMRAVSPRYAVPFASNHCHLHRDTVQFNDYIQTPLDVAARFETIRQRESLPTELKVMLPGSSWSSSDGFTLVDTSAFDDRKSRLAAYAAENADKLRDYYALESKVSITTENMRAFFGPFMASVPWLVRRTFRNRPIVIIAEGGAVPGQWSIDLHQQTVTPIDAAVAADAPARMHVPAMVLRQSLRMNMFDHAAISKRVRYVATSLLMPHLKRFELLLRAYELEFLPLRRNLSLATLTTCLRRWRELVFYVQVAAQLALGRKAVDIEQHMLMRLATRPRPNPG